jgi:hypothetical protein
MSAVTREQVDEMHRQMCTCDGSVCGLYEAFGLPAPAPFNAAADLARRLDEVPIFGQELRS